MTSEEIARYRELCETVSGATDIKFLAIAFPGGSSWQEYALAVGGLATLDALDEAQAEITRHHADFERWEAMAARGAGKSAALDEAVELLPTLTRELNIRLMEDRERFGASDPLADAAVERAGAFLSNFDTQQEEDDPVREALNE